MKTLLCHVASVLLCLGSVSLHAETAFEAAGLWNTISHADGSEHLQTNQRPFFVAVNGQDMFIRVNSGNRDKGMAYHEYGISAGTGYEFVRFQNTSGTAQNDATLAI